ncbi:MAG TPA: DNA polymerase III subunit gamma/tau, partial [Dehalococcoidia bacterium]|nr:DNA polymerase III subunit gamma/tau [Dehalococcoidia bacterium]
AKAINCEQNMRGEGTGEPCNECASCVAYNEGRALDLVEMDGASNRGINEIRELRDKANYAPTGGAEAHKVYLIDEVHMLTGEAFNALLKTLEEPPPHIVFILATTDAHKVPATILSRCQRHDFRRIPLSAIVDRLWYIGEQEGMTVGRDALELVARSATGSLRDAINLLEQVTDSFGKDASIEAVREGLGLVADERAAQLALEAARGQLAEGLATIGAVRDDGLDLRQFQKETVSRMRDLLLAKAGAGSERGWTPEQLVDMKASVEGVEPAKLVRVLKLFSEADLRADPLSPLPLELALAESTLEPVAPSATASSGAAPRAASPMAGRADTRPAPPPGRPTAPPARPPERPAARPAASPRPAPSRGDLKDASAEDIAAMLGSKSPVIPPAADEAVAAEPAPTRGEGNAESTPGGAGAKPVAAAKGKPAAANGKPAGANGNANGAGAKSGPLDEARLAAFVDDELRPAAYERNQKLGALLNGSCRAVSWEDGVLTLGFFEDKFHKKTVEEAVNLRVYEQIASGIVGAPVSIRCIIAPRPARAMSPLVQHAVENHGAKIISDE